MTGARRSEVPGPAGARGAGDDGGSGVAGGGCAWRRDASGRGGRAWGSGREVWEDGAPIVHWMLTISKGAVVASRHFDGLRAGSWGS